MSHETKTLTRDPKNGLLFGVCAGIAKYFSWDVTIVRIVTVLLTFSWGGGLIAYIAAAILMKPEEMIIPPVDLSAAPTSHPSGATPSTTVDSGAISEESGKM